MTGPDRALILAACLFVAGPVSLAGDQEPVLDELDEVLIVGRQPGPALWQVKSGITRCGFLPK